MKLFAFLKLSCFKHICKASQKYLNNFLRKAHKIGRRHTAYQFNVVIHLINNAYKVSDCKYIKLFHNNCNVNFTSEL